MLNTVNRKISTLFIAFNILASICTSLKAQDDSSHRQVITMLQDFYTKYMNLIAGPIPAEDQLTALRKSHCTSTLLARIKKDDLDYDPFIKAQDADSANLRTLLIREEAQKDHAYLVSYVDGFSHTTITMYLTVVKQKGVYRINSLR